MACISLFMLVFVVVTSFGEMVEAVPSPQPAENGNGRCPIGDCYFGVPCPFGTTPTYKFCNMAFGSKCCESPRGTSNMCEKAGGKCISRKKRCNGNVDKRIKCDKKREVCCISDNLTTQLSTDISDNHTTSSPMVDINDGLAPGSKCGMPQPKMGWSGGPVFVRHVSKATQELFDALRQQVQEKIHHGKPFEEFIVDCYLKQLVAVTSYKAQVNVNGNHCIRIHAFQPLGPPDKPLIFKSVQDNMPCEEKQDQVDININGIIQPGGTDDDHIRIPYCKCEFPKPPGGLVGGWILVTKVSAATQELLVTLKPQVEAILGYTFTFFLVECYLGQVVAGYNYNAQVTIDFNHAIRIQVFQPLVLHGVRGPLELKGVQDNVTCYH